MSAIVSPIYTGQLGGDPLRFFKAPRLEPHLVWHSVDDLHRCLVLPRDLRRHCRQSLQRDHRPDIATIATDVGIDIIAPHWMAQGLIGAMIEIGRVSADVERIYAGEAAKAQNSLSGDLPPGASLDHLLAAYRNTHGIGGGAR